MTGLISIHKGVLPLVKAMLPIWEATFDKIVWVLNKGESTGSWWPDGHSFVGEGEGRDGVSSLKKLHSVLKYMYAIGGDVCLCESDACLLTPHLSPHPKDLWGSQLWTANEVMGAKGYLARKFLHSPLIASHEAWGEILATLEQWSHPQGYYCLEHGMGDRWLALAAATSGLQLYGIGASHITNTIPNRETLVEILKGNPLSIHGIKDPALVPVLLGHMFKRQDNYTINPPQ